MRRRLTDFSHGNVQKNVQRVKAKPPGTERGSLIYDFLYDIKFLCRAKPRKARIDAPGALQHIIARGIARRKVFDDNDDRDFFVDRLGLILTDTNTIGYFQVYAPPVIWLCYIV